MSKDKAIASVFDDTDTPINESKRFITLVNYLYTITNVSDIDVEIELDIPEKRIPIAKRKDDEKCFDHIRQATSKGCKADDHKETVSADAKLFEIKTFNIIMDSKRRQLGYRFVINKTVT